MFFGTLHQLTQGLSGSEAIIAIKENHKLSPSHFDGFFSGSQQTFIFLIPNKFKPHVPLCETLAYLLCIIRTRIIYNNKLGIQPKISGFGAVDDVGKRPISLWHKQTPGILGVDFYPDRLYNIL